MTGLLGAALARVELLGEEWEPGTWDDRVWSCPTGLRVVHQHGAMDFTWGSPFADEGLLAGSEATRQLESTHASSRYVRIVEPVRSAVAGAIVTGLTVVCYLADPVAESRPWALILGLESGASLAVCLGDIGAGGPEFIPDAVLAVWPGDDLGSMVHCREHERYSATLHGPREWTRQSAPGSGVA